MKEGLGAYGQRGGITESVVKTSELSAGDILKARNRIVEKYKPKAHRTFFETHLAGGTEYAR